MVLYILLAAFFGWLILSPLYPQKAVPTLEEIELTRHRIEALEQSTTSLFEILWPLAACVFLLVVFCFVLKIFGRYFHVSR